MFCLLLFPSWAQEAHWLLTDSQRACAAEAPGLKRADQVFAPKPTGGAPTLGYYQGIPQNQCRCATACVLQNWISPFLCLLGA